MTKPLAFALALGFTVAQAVNWTDCGEGLFCAAKDRCASDCASDGCEPCEDSICAHLEPQSDVVRDDAPSLPEVESVAFEAPAAVPPAFAARSGTSACGLPPPARKRPAYITQHAFLS